jgi:hypothetical protein
MNVLTRMRRHVLTALMIAALVAATGPASSATRGNVARPGISHRICSYDWSKGTWQLKQLIKCAARNWKVAGGPDKALSVARCESRFNPKAYNTGGYAGVFQQSIFYWPGRARAYGFRDRSVYNGRANIIVSIRMAHREGWGPWSCA